MLSSLALSYTAFVSGFGVISLFAFLWLAFELYKYITLPKGASAKGLRPWLFASVFAVILTLVAGYPGFPESVLRTVNFFSPVVITGVWFAARMIRLREVSEGDALYEKRRMWARVSGIAFAIFAVITVAVMIIVGGVV